jgi:hypothetical protein
VAPGAWKANDGRHYVPDPKRPANICWWFIMPDFSLVPVEHQPDFADVSLVPVDHDPFSADRTTQQAQVHQAETQNQQMPTLFQQARLQSPLQQRAAGASQPNAAAPADRSTVSPTDHRSHAAPGDSYPTAGAAAIAALQDINLTSQRYGLEYAGRVYHKWLGFGNYSYTPPSEGTAISSSPGDSVITPLLHSLGVNAGTYHRHTRGADPTLNENYSPADKSASDYEGEPSYLGAPSGIIYKYLPIANQPSQGRITALGNTNGSSNSSPAQP